MKKEYLELAEQLKCPSGERAKEVADTMFASNENMIKTTIENLRAETPAQVLEIGFGNAKHLAFLFRELAVKHYTGIDISKAMVAEANLVNKTYVAQQKANFLEVDGKGELQFTENYFTHCFTANTLYFWEKPQQYFNEIFRVLKPKGQLVIACIAKEFGEQLPFTQKGFTFYSKASIKTFFKNAGFAAISSIDYSEDVKSKDGQWVRRPFFIIEGEKLG